MSSADFGVDACPEERGMLPWQEWVTAAVAAAAAAD